MKANFNSIINSPKPVLVDVFAEWCGPCKTQSPILKEIAEELGDNVQIIKIDAEKNGEIASRYNIQGVPTIMLFKDGNLKYKQAGLHSKSDLKKLLISYL